MSDLRIEGNTGARSRMIDGEVEASRMAYLRLSPPHSHGVLRLLVDSPDRIGTYLKRGGAPTARDVYEIGGKWPLDLPFWLHSLIVIIIILAADERLHSTAHIIITRAPPPQRTATYSQIPLDGTQSSTAAATA